MATKIGKQQRKKRFTEAGVVFTEAFVSRVNRLTGGGAGGGDGPHGSPAAAAAEAVGGDGVHTLHLNGGAANEGAGAATEASSSFVEGMRGFTILGSTYAEIEALKGLIDALVRLGRGGTDGSASCTSGGGASCAQTPNDVGGSHGSGVDDDADACVPHPSFEACARVFLGVMFLGNSRPLHRHLITSVRRLPPAARAMAEAALIEEVLDALAQGRRCAGSGAAKLRSMTALASINGCQPQTGMEQRVMRRVAVPAAALVAEGITLMIDESLAGRTIPPAEMEVAHDAIAVAYSVVQRHAEVFVGDAAAGDVCAGDTQDDPKPAAALASLVKALARSLQRPTLSREAAISAGVTLAAAAGVGACARAHAAVLADAFFPVVDASGARRGSWVAASGVPPPPIDATVLSGGVDGGGTSLAAEAARFTAFGRLSAVRGLLTAAAPAALSARLTPPPGAPGGVGDDGCWGLLLDGALPAICAAMERPIDAHFKFHASAALRSALTRAKQMATEAAERASSDELSEETETDEPVAMDVDGPSSARWKGPLTLSDALSSRVLAILWANWEDPLSQTVREVQGAFEQLLDLKSTADPRTAGTPSVADGAGRAFLVSAASQLLAKSSACKGRYVPLAALVPRLGARALLELRPGLLRETLAAMRDDSVCCACGTLVAALSSQLLRELQRDERGGDGGEGDRSSNGKTSVPKKGLGGRDEVCLSLGSGTAVTAWRRWWIPPLLAALLSPGRERVGAAYYALPPLLKQDGASIVPLLEALVEGVAEEDEDGERADEMLHPRRKRGRTSPVPEVSTEAGVTGTLGAASGERRSAALVALLRAARAVSLLDPTCLARVSPAASAAAGRTTPYEVPREMLERAVVCKEPRTRCDALEMVCIDGKRASLPGPLELDLLRRALPACLRGDGAAFRNALGSMTRGLLARIKVGTGRVAAHIRQRARRAAASGENFSGGERFGANLKGAAAMNAEEAEEAIGRARECVRWSRWLVRMLLASAYPGAPYERKYMALDLLNAVAETWGPGVDDRSDGKEADGTAGGGSSGERPGGVAIDAASEAAAAALEASPYLPCLGAECTTSLLGAAVDSWDKLRVSAFKLLARHPPPLAGMETPEKLEARLRWALALLRSPRVRESDAAALLLRLLFRKYAMDLGWDVRLSPEPKAVPPPPGAPLPARAATGGRLLERMCDLIEDECRKAELDLLSSCRQSLAHGALLATRYMLAEIPFASAGKEERDRLKAGLARLLSLLSRVTDVALASIAAPDGALIGTQASELNPDKTGGGSGQGAAAAAAAAAATAAASTGGVGWGSYFGDEGEDAAAEMEDDGGDADDGSDGGGPGGESLAPRAQMVVTACWLTMKEVSLLTGDLAAVVPLPGAGGARDAVGSEDGEAGLLDPSQLEAAGAHLMRVLLQMKHNGAIEKTRVGLTCLGERLLRSSNAALSRLPGAWLNELFGRLAVEGQGVKDLIRRSAGIPFGFMAVFLAEPSGMPRALLHTSMARLLDIAADDGDSVRKGGVAKGASEGVHVPQVHALNVLRVAFQDKDLSTDTTSFVAQGMQVSMRAFSSPHWEVRNAATLSFASILTKVCGYMNHAAPTMGGSARRAVTGDEFFHRFPALHPFLLDELDNAVALLEAPKPKVHPSLYPILALLSRLRPSAATRNRDARHLAPSAFVPLVRRCARGRPLAVRAAAARALAPLIAPDDVAAALRTTLGNLAAPRRSKATEGGSTVRFPAEALYPRVGYNAAHGCLMCCRAMLAPGGPAHGADPETKAEAVAAATEGLAACAYLSEEAPFVAAVSAEWLATAEAVMDLCAPGSKAEEGLRRMAWAASNPAGFERFGAAAPADVTWAKTAARLRVRMALAGNRVASAGDQTKDVPEAMPGAGHRAAATATVRACLDEALPYEAVAAAMKALVRADRADHSAVAAALDVAALRAHLCTVTLSRQTRHSCLRRGLELVAAWTPRLERAPGSAPTGGCRQNNEGVDVDVEREEAVAATVERLASTHPNERVRCAALRCLGRITAAHLAASTTQTTRVAALAALVKVGAGAERPVDTRAAAAAALAASSLLARLPPAVPGAIPDADDAPAPGPPLGEPVLAAWLAAFELMEDEDEEVRETAAEAAACAAGIPVDTQTEACLRGCFAVVAKRLARWPPFERYLVQTAAGSAVKAAGLRAVVAEVNLVRRLFDREADNHHAEGLLLSQLAAKALRETPALRPAVSMAALEATLTSAEEAAAALAEVASSNPIGGGGGPTWAGGATNHESAFVPVCKVFLALWALAPAVQPLAAGTASRVKALDETLTGRPNVLGPMAARMWAAALGAMNGGAGGDSCAAEWDDAADAFANLDPCFLLQ